MFQILMRLNRYSAVAAAALFLLSLLVPSLQSLLGLDRLTGLRIYVAILSGLVLADKPLARLSFNEVCREVAGVNLEEATSTYWRAEEQRRLAALGQNTPTNKQTNTCLTHVTR